MSPQKVVEQVSSDTGITVRVLLSVVALMVSIVTTAGGIGVMGIVKITSLEHEIVSVQQHLKYMTERTETATAAQFLRINEELDRRTVDRWTRADMAAYVRVLERTLQAAGVQAQLPDPKERP